MNPLLMAMNGVNDIITSVIFQLSAKAITNPAMKVAAY